MSRITGFFVTASLAILLIVPAHADDASKRVKIDQLFTLLHMQKNTNALVDMQSQQVKKMLPGLFPNLKITPEQQKDFDAFLEKMTAISRESLDWNKLEPKFIDIYAATYDEPTVDALLAFYRSDAGQTMIAKQPELIQKSQAITQQQVVEMQPKMRETFQQFMAEMQKKYPTQPAPATQPAPVDK